MNLNEMIDILNEDLANEIKHLLFYSAHASSMTGPERLELQEFFIEQAKSELEHVQQFSNLIVGLGGIPESQPSSFNRYASGNKAILQEALRIEQDVVKNYALRIEQAQSMEGLIEDKKYIEIFLEDQLKDSRSDIDNICQILRGM